MRAKWLFLPALATPALAGSNFGTRTSGSVFTVTFDAAECAGGSFSSAAGETSFWATLDRDANLTACPTDGSNGVDILPLTETTFPLATAASAADAAAALGAAFTVEMWFEVDLSSMGSLTTDTATLWALDGTCAANEADAYSAHLFVDGTGDVNLDADLDDVCDDALTSYTTSDGPPDSALFYALTLFGGDFAVLYTTDTPGAKTLSVAQSLGGEFPTILPDAFLHLGTTGELFGARVHMVSLYDSALASGDIDANIAAFLPNSPPAPVAVAVDTDEDVQGTLTLECYDFDVDHQAWNAAFDAAADTPVAVVASLPSQGQLFDPADGAAITSVPHALAGVEVEFLGDADEYGTPYTTFAFECQDQEAASLTSALATVTVNAVNDAPVAISQAHAVYLGAVSQIWLAGSDLESWVDVGTVQTLPSDGQLWYNGSRIEEVPFSIPQDDEFDDKLVLYYNYTGPTADFEVGATRLTNDSFTFTVADATGLESENTALLTVMVDNPLEPNPTNLPAEVEEEVMNAVVLQGADHSGAQRAFSFVVESAPAVGTLYLDSAGASPFAYPQTVEQGGGDFGEATVYWQGPEDYFNNAEAGEYAPCGPGAFDGLSFPLKLVIGDVHSDSKDVELRVDNVWDPITLTDTSDIEAGEISDWSAWSKQLDDPDADCFDFRLQLRVLGAGRFSYTEEGAGWLSRWGSLSPFDTNYARMQGNLTGFNNALADMLFKPATEGTDTLEFELSRPETDDVTTTTEITVNIEGTFIDYGDDDGDDSPLGFTIDWKIAAAAAVVLNCCVCVLIGKCKDKILATCCSCCSSGAGAKPGSAKLDDVVDVGSSKPAVAVEMANPMNPTGGVNPGAAAAKPAPPGGRPPQNAVPPPSSEWEEFTTDTGEKYYHNKHTRRTTWTTPTG